MADWKKIVGAVAPKLATALGGPLAGAATAALAAKLGVTAPPGTAIDEKAIAQAIEVNPEALLRIKEADQAFAVRMKELEIDVDKIDADDRDSARRRQVDLKDHTPTVLALAILSGFFTVQAFLLRNAIPQGASEAISRTLGTLDTMTAAVVFYYFGSSRGSRAKDKTIDKALEKQ